MSRKFMSNTLRFSSIIIAVLCALFFFVFIPAEGKQIALDNPEYAFAYTPCLIWALCFSLPVFLAFIPSYMIFGTIAEKGKAFCRENAARFKLIARLAFADAVVFPAGMITVACLGAGSAVLTIVVTPIVMIAALIFGFACLVMSHLVKETAEIREENDMTI